MGKSEPHVCDVCGDEIQGPEPAFYAKFEEWGRAEVGGRFCSLEHAAEWAANPPDLIPLKHPYHPGAEGMRRYGSIVLLAVVFGLVCLVVGLVTVARSALGWVV